jgi:hypothetical protein
VLPAQRSGARGEHEEAHQVAARVVGPVGEHRRHAGGGQRARQRAARERSALGLGVDRPAAVLLPEPDQGGDERDILLERLLQLLDVDRSRGKAVDPHRALAALLQSAQQHLVRDQAVQRTLHPAEELGVAWCTRSETSMLRSNASCSESVSLAGEDSFAASGTGASLGGPGTGPGPGGGGSDCLWTSRMAALCRVIVKWL